MSEQEFDIVESENWKPKVLIIGGALGALIGVGAAYLLIQSQGGEDGPPEITAGQGVKIGASVIALLRSISTLG
jgi:hypothetical protein